MKIGYHGHSVVSIETNDGTHILIDPFITGNKLTDLVLEEIHVDYIFITHGHADHVGDMVYLAKKNNAHVVGIPEVCHFATSHGVKNVHHMNLGGSFAFPFGTVKMIFAQHSSGYELDGQMIYMEEPAGFLFNIDNRIIYHAGDTAFYNDMSLIADDFDVDIAFLPIGDNFTMGINDAVKAAKTIDARVSVPIHYNTFPVIEQNPEKFVDQLSEQRGKVLQSGDFVKY
ncbi:metal-dependent hydrolase [Vagococcus sp. JNUCC 83]